MVLRLWGVQPRDDAQTAVWYAGLVGAPRLEIDAMADTARPTPLGLAPSFGFGDRLGTATPGHVKACLRGNLQPIFAQQSVREMARTNRTPSEVMVAAQRGIREAGWSGPWGADADHLKTGDDVRRLAEAGFTFFTIDPSEYVDGAVGSYASSELEAAIEQVIAFGAFESVAQIDSLYLGRRVELSDTLEVPFDDREALYRGVVKYGKALLHAERMAGWIASTCPADAYEIELSVDETPTPTSTLEHVFIALELCRRDVPIVSLAPRFVGEFEKGIDYKGDLAAFESSLAEHVAIARRFGPYKISVHSGSDKFSIYPIVGRVCGGLMHVKTAGTSYLEALRVAARMSPPLFRDIVTYALGRFDEDRATYHISADVSRIPPLDALDNDEMERHFLDLPDGRQVLHVTFGSVLTSADPSFRPKLLNALDQDADLHAELLEEHLGRHIELLNAG